jgi:hypothetical protein
MLKSPRYYDILIDLVIIKPLFYFIFGFLRNLRPKMTKTWNFNLHNVETFGNLNIISPSH